MVQSPFRFREHFGAALRAHREAAQVRPAEVAASLGRDQATIWRWEKGRGWPRDPDLVVAVYSSLAGGTPMDLWDDAARRGRKAEAEAKLRDMTSASTPAADDDEPPDHDLGDLAEWAEGGDRQSGGEDQGV